MAEVVGIVIGALGVIQNYSKALSLDSKRLRDPILVDTLNYMRVLGDCVEVIENVKGDEFTESIQAVMARCAELGKEMSYQYEPDGPRMKPRRYAYRLVSDETIKALLLDFKENVTLLQSMIQSLLLQRMVVAQRDISITMEKSTIVNGHAMRGLYEDSRKQPSQYQGSVFSRATSTTTRAGSVADVVTLADEVVTRSIAKGVHFGNDLSLTIGTIVLIHKEKPTYVPVRAKFDTGSDANFIPYSLVHAHGLQESLVELEDEGPDANTFQGLDNHEYQFRHTITLSWCAMTMNRVRNTLFYVADNVPYDMLLGNDFIRDNSVFEPPRIALPLRSGRKSSDTAQQEEEVRRRGFQEDTAAEESQRVREEGKRIRALEREARRLAKEQTSAASMIPVSPSNNGANTPATANSTGGAIGSTLSPSTKISNQSTSSQSV